MDLKKIEITRPNVKTLVNTIGPRNRFKHVLFIEKEGFDEILKGAKIQERYDIALMSTKGNTVKACCDLNAAFEGQGVKVFVVHDFDKDGLKILNSLREGVRLSMDPM